MDPLKPANDSTPEHTGPEKQAKTAPLSSAGKAMSFNITRHIIFASLVIGLLVGTVGLWAAQAELTGAVIAPGSIVVDKNVKKLQHRDGGIISKIHVRNGDKVQAGDTMLELDDTQIRAEMGVILSQLTELVARSARLKAEIHSEEEVTFPPRFEELTDYTKKVTAAERRLFHDTRKHLNGQKEQLKLQIEQLAEEVAGITAQREAKQSQIELIGRELGQIEHLYKKNLTSVTRLYALQREQKRLSGELGGLTAQIARTKNKISEIRLQILSIGEEARLQAQRERRSAEARIAELREKEIAANDRLKRSKMLAPQSGIVHDMTVHTVGGVITTAETVLLIVPSEEKLSIEARIAPVDIDQVAIGGPVKLRFSAFNQRTTPELDGRIIHVAADLSKDESTGQAYYLARVEVEKDQLQTLSTLSLIPGMPVETFISTGTRTALSYFAKPITDQLRRAFREE